MDWVGKAGRTTGADERRERAEVLHAIVDGVVVEV